MMRQILTESEDGYLYGQNPDQSDDQSMFTMRFKTVYEDDEWFVYITRYDYLLNGLPLFVNVRKSDGAKFYFHFESDQFVDANKAPIKLNEIGLSEGTINFYSKIDPAFKSRLEFDWVGDFREGFAPVQLNGKWNFINKEGQLVSKQWFDNERDFIDGFAAVKLNGKWGKIDTEGNLTLKESRHPSAPIITESILRHTITECVRRILSQK